MEGSVLIVLCILLFVVLSEGVDISVATNPQPVPYGASGTEWTTHTIVPASLCSNPADLAVNSQTHTLFVACNSLGTDTVLSVNGAGAISTLLNNNPACGPNSVDFDPVTGLVFSGCAQCGDTSIYSLSGANGVTQIPISECRCLSSIAVVNGGESVYFSCNWHYNGGNSDSPGIGVWNSASVCYSNPVYNATVNGTVLVIPPLPVPVCTVVPVTICGAATEVVVNAFNSFVYAVCQQGTSYGIIAFDGTTVTSVYPHSCSDLTVSSAGLVYAACSGNGHFVSISDVTATIIQPAPTIPAGTNPGIAIDDGLNIVYLSAGGGIYALVNGVVTEIVWTGSSGSQIVVDTGSHIAYASGGEAGGVISIVPPNLL